MENEIISVDEESEEEFTTVLLDAIPGDKKGKYFILGNRNNSASPQEVDGFIVEVQSTNTLDWNLIFIEENWFVSIKRFTTTSYMIGTIEGDFILVKNGTRHFVQTGLDEPIHSVWGNSDNDCWLAHGAGIAFWDGKTITKNYVFDMVYAIAGVDTQFAVAVGISGAVLFFNGQVWKNVESSPVNTDLLSVFCVSRDEIYVGGKDGKLYRWDGGEQWVRIVLTDDGAEISASVHSIILYKNEIYASVASAGLFKVINNNGKKLHDDYSSRLAVIDDKLISTGLEFVLEYDGQNWKKVCVKIS